VSVEGASAAIFHEWPGARWDFDAKTSGKQKEPTATLRVSVTTGIENRATDFVV